MKWELKKYDNDYLYSKSKEFKENKFITAMLLNRGITSKKEVEKFLYSDEKDFIDPFLLDNMDIVVAKILDLKNSGEKITIYGDYDIDGISATAYLVIVLRKIGLNVDYYIPNRLHDGAVINKSLINVLLNRKTKLFLTVDTSISTPEEVVMLKNNGIDIIITDHHHDNDKILGFNIPTINPKTSEGYTNKNLSGVGVAFKLACAIYERANADKKILYDYLDIVMIGTVADVVPMVDENRLIIKKVFII